MDFGALPPEINSGRMYSGPGCGSMLAAAAAWDGLADDLHSTAGSYQSVIWDLIGAAWLGPSSASMAAAVAPYIEWMTTTAALCEETATNARAAAAAYEAAFAMTVPPPMVAANRTLLMSLIATNFLGQNTPAIAATEADYGEMWAQDAGAMYEYAGASAAASPLPSFTSAPPTTNPAGVAGQVAAVAHASATSAGTGTQTVMSTGSQLLSGVPTALQGLALPLPAGAQLLSLLSPVNLAVASASTAITSTGTGGSHAGLGYAVHYDPAGASKADAILARLGAVPGGSGTGTLASSGSADLGAGSRPAPALSAGSGQASSIGALSVPPRWVAATPSIRQVAVAWPNILPGATPTVLAASPENPLNEMLLASMALRGI
ncbi:MAG: PPE domain-containing protein, partial [Mycobacterium sp.]|nr:PPE domain-containing protein [Mycobacterium sp.]